jgi:hypothetical protein
VNGETWRFRTRLAGAPLTLHHSLLNHVEATIYLWVDQDQIELTLPPCLLAELGRLQLALELMSEGE